MPQLILYERQIWRKTERSRDRFEVKHRYTDLKWHRPNERDVKRDRKTGRYIFTATERDRKRFEVTQIERVT